MGCYDCPRLGQNPKNVQAFKVTTADLLIKQAKVRRNAFITIQVTFTTNYEISTYRVHVLYYLTETFVYFWG